MVQEISSVETAIEELNKDNISRMEEALSKATTNSELISFIINFAPKKECEFLIKVLTKLHDSPQVLKKKNSFETIYHAGMLDGERNFFRKFMSLIVAANSADMQTIEELINK